MNPKQELLQLHSNTNENSNNTILKVVPTSPIPGMKPGTSGLRKKVKTWQEKSYLENFVQCIFDSQKESVQGSILVLGGDGRYFNAEAIQTIIKIAAANGISKIWVGKDGLLSTPAVSAIIREKRDIDGRAATLGIVLTASHNPGGPNADFGIKFNNAAGSPATEAQTEALYGLTNIITSYNIIDGAQDIELSQKGVHVVGNTVVEVIDGVEDYINLLRRTFDFNKIRSLIARSDFTMVYDAMHGVSGIYAKRVLVEELGADCSSLLRCEPLEDFGGCHPDPNLTYASELVKILSLSTEISSEAEPPVFGAAGDGDGDRNMILGKGCFVTPSDSLAIIAANAKFIPHFKGGVKSAARSMPTSAAIDRVGAVLNFPVYETPTGWKYFGNLMDSALLGGSDLNPFLCGEESFGTGSNHIREKDGLWAVLAWLSILAAKNPVPSEKFVGVDQILAEHWATFGRNFYCRYDYEGVSSEGANQMVERLRSAIVQPEVFQILATKAFSMGFKLLKLDDFYYVDPIDKSISTKQGIRMLFESGVRAVFRLSGTGSEGATIRLYIEKFEPNQDLHHRSAQEELAEIHKAASAMAMLHEFTGRHSPTVIT